jgi:hypothetical protein
MIVWMANDEHFVRMWLDPYRVHESRNPKSKHDDVIKGNVMSRSAAVTLLLDEIELKLNHQNAECQLGPLLIAI